MKYFSSVGFYVLTLVTMKGTIFWDVMPCSPVEVVIVFTAYFMLDGCLA
jgi:hypothetical protein